MPIRRSILFLFPRDSSLGERYKKVGEFLLAHPHYEENYKIYVRDTVLKRKFEKIFYTKGLEFENIMEVRDVYELPG